jgi:hypothetical protein
MKSAKLILSGIAIFAIVGGAFAFKAQKFGTGNVWVYSTTATTIVNGPIYTVCTFRDDLKTTILLGSVITAYASIKNIGTLNNVCSVPFQTIVSIALD